MSSYRPRHMQVSPRFRRHRVMGRTSDGLAICLCCGYGTCRGHQDPHTEAGTLRPIVPHPALSLKNGIRHRRGVMLLKDFEFRFPGERLNLVTCGSLWVLRMPFYVRRHVRSPVCGPQLQLHNFAHRIRSFPVPISGSLSGIVLTPRRSPPDTHAIRFLAHQSISVSVHTVHHLSMA